MFSYKIWLMQLRLFWTFFVTLISFAYTRIPFFMNAIVRASLNFSVSMYVVGLMKIQTDIYCDKSPDYWIGCFWRYQKRYSEIVNRKTDNIMDKGKRTKGQTMVYKTPAQKTKDWEHWTCLEYIFPPNRLFFVSWKIIHVYRYGFLNLSIPIVER
jgi:hypothetical protein